MSGRTLDRRCWAGGGKDQEKDQQRPDQQQQPIPQLESLLVFPGCIHQVANRRENHDRGLPSLNEMKKDRNTGSEETCKNPRVKKGDHAIPAGWTRARLSAIPKGVSVVMR